MGWLSSTNWGTRNQLIKERVADWETDKAKCTYVAHCLRGNCLWKVGETTLKETGEVIRWIGLDLLKNFGKGEGWGYKDMDETVHPYYYTCPVKYLNLQPRVDCQAWRDTVLAKAAIQKIPMKIGSIVGLRNCIPGSAKIISKCKGNRWIAESRGGTRFSLTKRHLSGEVFEDWPLTD